MKLLKGWKLTAGESTANIHESRITYKYDRRCENLCNCSWNRPPKRFNFWYWAIDTSKCLLVPTVFNQLRESFKFYVKLQVACKAVSLWGRLHFTLVWMSAFVLLIARLRSEDWSSWSPLLAKTRSISKFKTFVDIDWAKSGHSFPTLRRRTDHSQLCSVERRTHRMSPTPTRLICKKDTHCHSLLLRRGLNTIH